MVRGSVSYKTYLYLMRCIGWGPVALIVITFVMHSVFAVSTNFWLSSWSEAGLSNEVGYGLLVCARMISSNNFVPNSHTLIRTLITGVKPQNKIMPNGSAMDYGVQLTTLFYDKIMFCVSKDFTRNKAVLVILLAHFPLTCSSQVWSVYPAIIVLPNWLQVSVTIGESSVRGQFRCANDEHSIVFHNGFKYLHNLSSWKAHRGLICDRFLTSFHAEWQVARSVSLWLRRIIYSRRCESTPINSYCHALFLGCSQTLTW